MGGYGRKLRPNKDQGQVHPNVAGVYVPIIHVMGKDGPRKKTGKPTSVLRTDTISKAATKEGVVY